MAELERRVLTREIKMLDSDASGASSAGGFTGYASLKGEVDSFGDVIQPGAYQNLAEFVERGFIAEGHDWYGSPIGYVKSAVEDDRGLLIEAAFHNTERAQMVRQVMTERMAAGRSVGLSIGFFATDTENGKHNGQHVRLVKGLEVVETSVVTVPSMRNALVADVRSGAGSPLEDHVQNVLDAFAALSRRFSDLAEMRGRPWSAANVERLQALSVRADDCGAAIRALLAGHDTPAETDAEALAALEGIYKRLV